MNENLDLTEILKDCPKGTKLYSPALGECVLEEVTSNKKYPIKVIYKLINNDTSFDYFTKNGYLVSNILNVECMLFPSKDQRDWSKWHRPFILGDVVMYNDDQFAIFEKYIKYPEDDGLIRYYVYYDAENDDLDTEGGQAYVKRLATKEEKEKFFQAIKDNGYTWNAETKTLEKLKKEKFDPKTLQPFDKVLVRPFDDRPWAIDFYSCYDEYEKRAICTGVVYYDYCIPYNEDTKHLVGKMDTAPEFYRYWEE